MIYLSKSYKENISIPENKHYASLIDNLIKNGVIGEKYLLLLSTDDIANIVILSVLCIKEWNYDLLFDKIDERKKINTGCSLIYKDGKSWCHKQNSPLHKISELYNILPQQIKEQILFSFGMNIIISLGLDEIDNFKNVINIISDRYNGAKPINKMLYKGITE